MTREPLHRHTPAAVEGRIRRLTTRLSGMDAEKLLLAMAYELFGDSDDHGRAYYCPDRTIDRDEHRRAADMLRDAIFGEDSPSDTPS